MEETARSNWERIHGKATDINSPIPSNGKQTGKQGVTNCRMYISGLSKLSDWSKELIFARIKSGFYIYFAEGIVCREMKLFPAHKALLAGFLSQDGCFKASRKGSNPLFLCLLLLTFRHIPKSICPLSVVGLCP